MAHYALSYADITHLAKSLRRDERTVRDWLNAKRKVPFWVPELLRLRHMERNEIARQMGIYGRTALLGVVKGDVIHATEKQFRAKEKPQPIPGLRLDDFGDDAEPIQVYA
jgi:hypothetical protein